jgi:hypothetical protein
MLTAYGLTDSANVGDVNLPMLEVSATARGMNFGHCYLPLTTVSSTAACGLYDPINSDYSDEAYLSLLSYPNADLESIADSITSATDPDEIVLDLLTWVAANITEDTDTNIYGETDIWSCPLSTYGLGEGDDEDGALLLHALMLNAGVNPGRIRTCYGTWQDTPVPHTWTIYRRVTDGEWVVLEWTDFTPVANPLYLPKQELATDYKTVVFYLTLGGKITINQTITVFMRENVGTMQLPMLTVSARSVNIGTADIELPALTATVYTGARAEIELPSLECSGDASVSAIESGDITLPMLTVTGYTGAVSSLTLPMLTVSAVAHEGASGTVTLPMLTVSGVARAGLLANGSVELPMLSVSATGKSGRVATGDISLPMLRVSGHALNPGSIQGDVNLPMLTVSAVAHEEARAEGDITLPMFIVAATAKQADRFRNTILQYERY